jgi:spore coat polysaccharide biosynthesis predicted glycosyltransferase SpsG
MISKKELLFTGGSDPETVIMSLVPGSDPKTVIMSLVPGSDPETVPVHMLCYSKTDD